MYSLGGSRMRVIIRDALAYAVSVTGFLFRT